MEDIKCPHCQKVFKVDQAGFADIVKQVRDHQFEEELKNRLDQAEQAKSAAVELAKANLRNELQAALAQKEQEIASMKAANERAALEQQMIVNDAVSAIVLERNELATQLRLKESEQELATNAIKDQHTTQMNAMKEIIRMKEEEVKKYADMKAKLSTKMVGETLEKHCEVEFERLRSTAFSKASFGKDNDASSGTKGDYIFREQDEKGIELVSIMFEMKNESDEGNSKKKNEEFYKKLDKDRTEKNCEYAVLVSLLEPEDEIFNAGIVDVSHKFPKMFVIRPQFFIPIISLLRNASMGAMQYKTELAAVKEQNIDITNFETSVSTFKEAFAKNFKNASNKFDSAIVEIDKSIKALTKVKEELLLCENHLRLANNKTEDLTIKKLTRNNPTMKKMFDDLGNDGSSVEVVE
ncbi:DUF2130 domain-containing protein [Aquirufa sp.]|jgi:hypothetical protein|uniref:DUF2130 domain-containing protein n=1 Tax=Aquirufa sp. TaxID=2676249 RepID=UPI0037C10420